MSTVLSEQQKESADENHFSRTRRAAYWLMLPLVIVGLSVSVYLAWATIVSGKIAGCESSDVWDCEHVLKSQWSAWFGVPVSIPGSLIYLGILVSLGVLIVSQVSGRSQLARNGLVLGATAAFLSGLWFAGLQFFVLHKLCQWCLTIHSMSLLIFVSVCCSRLVSWRAFCRLAATASVAVAALAAGQVWGPAPKRYEVHRFDPVAEDQNPGGVRIQTVVSGSPKQAELNAPSGPSWLNAPQLNSAASPTIAPSTADVTMAANGGLRVAAEVAPTLVLEAPSAVAAGVPLDVRPAGNGALPPVSAQDANGVSVTPATSPTDPRAGSEDESSAIETQANPVSSATPLPPVIPKANADSPGPQARRQRIRAIPVATLTPLPDDPEPETGAKEADAKEADSTEADAKEAEAKDPNTKEAEPAGRYITFGGTTLNLKMNILNRPILGSPNAPVVFIELFDYTCPHCREMNRYIAEARAAYGDQLAVLVLPTPLSHYCNPYADGTSAQHADACELARLAIAVWKLNEGAFPEFHQWLSDPVQSRSAAEARLKADQLVNPEQLQQLMQSSYLTDFLRQHAEIYNMVGRGILPKLYSDKIGIIGKTNSANELLQQIAVGHDLAAAAGHSRR